MKQPNCIKAHEDGKSISIEIEKELGVEIVGDTKVKVAVEEDEDPWDVIDDVSYDDEVSNEIDNSVRDDYIKTDEKAEDKKQ